MSYVKNKKIKLENLFEDFEKRQDNRKAKREKHNKYVKKYKASLELPDAARPPRRGYEIEKSRRD